MKPLLMVVPLNPNRPCRAKQWLETPEVQAIADVKYLEPQRLGPPIYGKNKQLYTCGAVNKAVFEAVIKEWRQSQHRFFGLCLDDVVAETPGFLDEAMRVLTRTGCEVVGATIKEMPAVRYFGTGLTVLMRLWVAVRDCLVDVDWDTLWQNYELPDWEAAWMHYSHIQTCVFPNLKFNHLLPVSRDCSNMSRGSVTEYYDGYETRLEMLVSQCQFQGRALDIGGGETPLYHPNMDYRALPSVDVVHDMTKTPWPFADASFDLVHMSHSLEHVCHLDVPDVLAEVKRVLVPGGKLIVKVPDVARLAQGNNWWNVQPIFGDQNDRLEWRRHKCGFWLEVLKAVLETAGFQEVSIQQTMYGGVWPELTGECFKKKGETVESASSIPAGTLAPAS